MKTPTPSDPPEVADPRPLNRRPLLVRFGAMGDMILMTAVARRLSERFDAPCDVVASQGSPQLVFHGLPWIGDLFTIQSRRWNYWISRDQQNLVRQLRRRGPSPTFVLEDLEKVNWLLQRAGLDEGLVQRGGSNVPPRADLEHQLDFGLRLANAGSFPELGVGLGLSAIPASGTALPTLRLDDLERQDCAAWLSDRQWADQPLVLVQALSRRRRRGRWPAASWRLLIDAIHDNVPSAQVLLIGSAEEGPLLDQLHQSIDREAVHVVAGQLPLRRLFALLERSHSCISIDTGPAHAAAALGCPLVVLMGRADPRRNVPRGEAPVEVCTAYDTTSEACSEPAPEGRRTIDPGDDPWPDHWPSSRLHWESEHQLQNIDPESVIRRWREVARSARPDQPPTTLRHGA